MPAASPKLLPPARYGRARKESINWDTTQNLFIEGDNLEVLKLLQKSYHKKVKMIYIDPPYNTGKEFIYPDNFRDNIKNYMELTGQTEFRSLKLQKLIEGRRPNLHVSSDIAATTGTKADYIRQRAFDKSHYKKMVLAYLERFGSARRKDLDELLLNKLSDILTKEQKKTLITNLLQEMRREDLSIKSMGATRSAQWILYNPETKDDN